MGSEWLLLVDPSTLSMLAFAFLVLVIGSLRSLSLYLAQLQMWEGRRQRQREEGGYSKEHENAEEAENEENNSNDLKWQSALLLPLIGSLLLLVLFFFLDMMAPVLSFIFTLSSLFSACFVLYPLVGDLAAFLHIPSHFRSPQLLTRVTRESHISTSIPLALLPAALLVAVWFFTGFWALTDILAFCLGITALCFLRINNLKLATLILWMFFFYDIFWVFISPFIFKDSVMVSVARRMPSLPTVIIVPRVFLDGYSLLGMGDIILPGLYLAFLRRFDHFNGVKNMWTGGYFRVGLLSYVLGLILTIFVLVAFQAAQPALLYLVPSVYITTVFVARKDFNALWNNTRPTSMDEGRIDTEAPLEGAEEGRGSVSYKRLQITTEDYGDEVDEEDGISSSSSSP
ncbi:Signal peptide peptidase [Balamuthia mandrillaris]